MNDKFSPLSSEEFKKLAEIPMYVSLLIAYADRELLPKELEWADKVTSFRTKTAHHTLRNFYVAAHDIIHSTIKLVVSEMPTIHEERVELLVSKIEEANPLLAKLDERTHERLLDSFKSLALSIAEIDGGILNFFSHNPDEEHWLGLPMLKH